VSRTTTPGDTTFSEDTSTSRTGSGPASLATIRAAITAASKDAGYLHIPRRAGATTPPRRSSPPARLRLGQKPTFTEHAGALVLAEHNDEWAEARRYMGPEILAACRKPERRKGLAIPA
jgi:hypothetical protein